MYDLSKKLEKYYKEVVVLSSERQNQLYEYRRTNISRIKDGLKKYNEENNTNLNIIDDVVQGSLAMSTIITNENNDYDIDVAIVFDKEDVNNYGAEQLRNKVFKAIEDEFYSFKDKPEKKTSCIRIKYVEGYHVDVAIFKKSNFFGYIEYEHAGESWSKRGLKSVEEWFNTNNIEKNKRLRKVVRLSKKFCDLQDVKMPSGLIQSVLCNECFYNHERIDVSFYNTLKNIANRYGNEVTIPVDGNRSLTERRQDKDRVENYKNRINKMLNKLGTLFSSECSEADAISAWSSVFPDNYWTKLSNMNLVSTNSCADTEEFIEDLYPIDLKYNVNIEVKIDQDGYRIKPLFEYLQCNYFKIKHKVKINCKMITNATKYDKVLWKVKNEGYEAIKRNCIRGGIKNRGEQIVEPSSFKGNHYIECYLIKDGTCIGRGHVDVPIGDE